MDFQTILLVGVALIIAVFIHGFIQARRRTGKKRDGDSPARGIDPENAGDRGSFDPDGIGELRVRAEPQFGEDERLQEDEGVEATADEAPEEVLIINVMSKTEEQFNGAIILQTLLSLGFRYGELSIFHRHREARGKGPVLFSLANAVKPGTFDLDNIDTFYTPGMTLFMTLPGPQDPAAAYELMLDSAKRLAQELDGMLLDGNRSTLTHQAQQHDRERIREFTRRRMAVQKA